MASEVLSGAANASYTNNTGQNVRLVINYMSNTTSMTWAGVNVTASSTTIGKDIQNISGEFRSAVTGKLLSSIPTSSVDQNIYTYELLVSDKRTNLNEYQPPGALPKNPDGTYNNPGPSPGLGGNALVNMWMRWRFPFGLWPTLENSSLPRVPPVNNFGSGTAYYGPDSMNFRPYLAPGQGGVTGSVNLFYVPLTVSRGGNFPVELMLASGQSFSAVCGAFNAIVIKEDGT
jgi:hypothetical protein